MILHDGIVTSEFRLKREKMEFPSKPFFRQEEVYVASLL